MAAAHRSSSPSVSHEPQKANGGPRRYVGNPSLVPAQPTQRSILRRIALLNSHVAGAAFANRCLEVGIVVSVLQLIAPIASQQKLRLPDADETMQWSLLGTPEGLQRIQAFVQKTGAEALVTMDEFALLWLAGLRESFEPACRLLAPEQAVIERLRTKDSQCEFARRAGLNVLPTWSIASRDISQIPPSAYPVCIRPSTYSSVTPEFKAETRHSPQALHEFLAGREWTAPILAQPFISGPNMVVHCCRDSNGRWLELRAYRAPVKSRGFAVVLEESTLPPEIHKACRKFAELSGATGCFHFDMLQSEKDGKVYFLEINLRLGGSTGKVMELGLDEPMYLLRSYGFEPASRPRKLPRARAAGSIRMLAEHARNVLRKRDAEISYPRHNTPYALWTLLRYAVTLKDPSLARFKAVHWLGRRKKKSAPTRSRFYIPLDRVDDGWPCPSGTGSAQA